MRDIYEPLLASMTTEVRSEIMDAVKAVPFCSCAASVSGTGYAAIEHAHSVVVSFPDICHCLAVCVVEMTCELLEWDAIAEEVG